MSGVKHWDPLNEVNHSPGFPGPGTPETKGLSFYVFTWLFIFINLRGHLNLTPEMAPNILPEKKAVKSPLGWFMIARKGLNISIYLYIYISIYLYI